MLFAPFPFLSFDGNRYIRFGRTLQGISKKYRAISCILKVLTIFFTLATARSVFRTIRVLRPKSDRLSVRKKKRYVSFLLAKRLRVKVAKSLRVKKNFFNNNFEVAKILRVWLLSLPQKGGNSMKKETEKEREIYAIGSPSFENLTPNEKKAFFGTLLSCVIEHFKSEEEQNTKKQ